MTKQVDYRKIVEEYMPQAVLLKGFDRHILSVNLHKDKVEVFYSLWGVLNQMIIASDLEYDSAMQELMKIVHKTKDVNKCDITYFFYDDLPNPQLN